MKANIHPKYVECTVSCGCGHTFKTRSTRERIAIEICSQCHPFFTGKEKFVDTAGMVEKFQRKFDLVADAVAAKKKKEEDERKAKLAEQARKIEEERRRKEEERKKKSAERDAWAQRQAAAAAAKEKADQDAALSAEARGEAAPAPEGDKPQA